MDKHYDIKALLKFAFLSILMMLFTSIYGIVDGLFISNFAGGIAFASAEAAAPLVASLFVGYDPELSALTEHAFRIVSFTFLLMGYAVYGSSLFTPLGNGLVSAAISFLRTLGFELAFVLLLPLVFGMEGIWISMPAAECAAVLLTIVCFLAFRKRYGL